MQNAVGKPGKPGKRGGQQGQGMGEYILVVAVVALVMFLPSPLTHDMAPADYLVRALRTFFRGYSFLISVF